VFQKFATGHPKFGAERELRASILGIALLTSRLDAPCVQQKRPFNNNKNLKLGQVGGRVSAGMSEWAGALNALKQ
jgi:hypothetical protein